MTQLTEPSSRSVVLNRSVRGRAETNRNARPAIDEAIASSAGPDELGIRHSTEKPTIHVAKAGTPLPFDTLAHRTIFVDLTDWHSTEAGRSNLARFARAIKDPEYKVSNPITQANASFKMRESSDPQVRVIAELRERIASLERISHRQLATGVESRRTFVGFNRSRIERAMMSGLAQHKSFDAIGHEVVDTIEKEGGPIGGWQSGEDSGGFWLQLFSHTGNTEVFKVPIPEGYPVSKSE